MFTEFRLYSCFLTSLYHREGAGRKPYNPVSMLKAQLLKHLWRVPSDRRLSLLLKRNKRVARALFTLKGEPVETIFSEMRSVYDTYEQNVDVVPIEHLSRWISVFKTKQK